jgi:hypothetical protein
MSLRERLTCRRARHVAKQARSYDLYIQDANGHRLIQMTFEDVLKWAEESGHHMLAPGVSVYRRKPGTRLIDSQGHPEGRRNP